MKQKQAVTFIILVLVVVAGYLMFNVGAKRRDCESRALTAAIDMYPVNSGLSASQREVLQKDYERKYLETCK